MAAISRMHGESPKIVQASRPRKTIEVFETISSGRARALTRGQRMMPHFEALSLLYI